ncbi:unnamed protein product, partial [Symbiodinium sp. KB8]
MRGLSLPQFRLSGPGGSAANRPLTTATDDYRYAQVRELHSFADLMPRQDMFRKRGLPAAVCLLVALACQPLVCLVLGGVYHHAGDASRSSRTTLRAGAVPLGEAFQLPPEKVVEAVSKAGTRVTPSDVAAAGGLSLEEARRGVVELAGTLGAEAELEVSKTGELVYLFPRDVKGALSKVSSAAAAREAWNKAKPTVFTALRAAFGVALFASIAVIYTAIIAISTSSSDRDRDDRRRGGDSFGGGGFGFGPTLYYGPSPFDVIFYRPYYSYSYGGDMYDDWQSRSSPPKMGFLESVYSFVFGDGDPNAGRLDRQLAAVAALARRNGGVLTAEQMAPLLDPPGYKSPESTYNVNESWVLPAVSRLNGRPEVAADGQIVYVFDDLRTTAGETSSRKPPAILEEEEVPFSLADEGNLTLVVLLGVANLVGAAYLGAQFAGLAGYKLTGFLAAVKGFYPGLLAYAVGFFAAPAVRFFGLGKTNGEIQQRNQNRKDWLNVLQSGSVDGKLAQDSVYSTAKDDAPCCARSWKQQYRQDAVFSVNGMVVCAVSILEDLKASLGQRAVQSSDLQGLAMETPEFLFLHMGLNFFKSFWRKADGMNFVAVHPSLAAGCAQMIGRLPAMLFMFVTIRDDSFGRQTGDDQGAHPSDHRFVYFVRIRFVLGWYVSASECVGADGLCGVGERASLAWEQSSTVGVDGCGITYSALITGDPRRLYHSFDYGGHLCGVDPGVEDKGLLYWPRPKDPEYAICIGQCPDNRQDTVTALEEEAAVNHGASGVETATITSKQVRIPTYPSREIGGRFCLPLPLAETLDGNDGDGVTRLPSAAGSTALQWPRLPADTLPFPTTSSAAPAPATTSHPLVPPGEPFHQPAWGYPTAPPEQPRTARPRIADFPGLLPPRVQWPRPSRPNPGEHGPEAPEIQTSTHLPTKAGKTAPVKAAGLETGAGNVTKPEKHRHKKGKEDEDKDEDNDEDNDRRKDEGQRPEGDKGRIGHKMDDTPPTTEPASMEDRESQKDTVTHQPAATKPKSGKVDHELKKPVPKTQQQNSTEIKTQQQNSTEIKTDAAGTAENVSSRHHEPGRRMWEETARSSETAELARLLSQDDEGLGAWLRKTAWDIAGAWPVLVVLGVVFASLQGTGYLAFMRFCACPFTFGVLFLLILATSGMSVYSLAIIRTDEEAAEQLFGRYSDHPVLLSQVVGWSCAGVCVLLLGISIAIFPTMRRAIGCIDGAAQAIWEEPPLLRLPAVEMMIKTLFSVSWLIFFSFVITSGQIDPPTLDVNGTPVYTRIRRFSSTPLQKFYVFVYVGGYLWTLETLSLVFHFAASFYAVSWYFTPCRAEGNKVVETWLWRTGIAYALRYHLGSMAMGGFMTMVFRPIHAPMAVLAKLAKAGERHAPDGIMANCLGCVWCFEEVVRFVNKNAVICMVLNSSNYFVSATAAVQTLTKAGKDIAFLNGFTGSLHSLGMLATACLTAYLALLALGGLDIFADQSSPLFVENRIAVIVAVGLLSGAVASSFMSLFDVVFDTLIFCWLADLQPTETVFVPHSLLNALGQPQGRKELSDAEIDVEFGRQPAVGPGSAAASVGSPSQDGREAAKREAARKAAAEQDALRKAAEQEALREAAEREASRKAKQAREAQEAERAKWQKLQEEEAARQKAKEEKANEIELARAAAEEIRRARLEEEERKLLSSQPVAPTQAPAMPASKEVADTPVEAEPAEAASAAQAEEAPTSAASAVPEAAASEAPAGPDRPEEVATAEGNSAPVGAPEERSRQAPERPEGDSLQAAEQSEVFKAVGQTDPFAAPSEEPSTLNWVA